MPYVQGGMQALTGKFFRYWLPLYIYAGAIFYISGLPHPLPKVSIPHLDKLLHLIEYAVFGILAARAFKNSPREKFSRNFIILAIIAAAAYAASDEFHQYFIPSRSCDALDLTVDVIGGTIGAVFYGRYNTFQRRPL